MTSLPHVNREQKKQYTVPCLIAAQIPWVSFRLDKTRNGDLFVGNLRTISGLEIILGLESFQGLNRSEAKIKNKTSHEWIISWIISAQKNQKQMQNSRPAYTNWSESLVGRSTSR